MTWCSRKPIMICFFFQKQAWRMRSWLPYRQCSACTPHSTRCWFTSSLAHPDTSPLVGKVTGSSAGTEGASSLFARGILCSGTFAVISIMIGSVTERMAPNSNFVVNGTNGTGNVDIAARDAYRVQIACALSVLTGLIQVCLYRFSSDPHPVRNGFILTAPPPLISDHFGCGKVWFCGHLPVGAAGPRLHHRFSLSCVHISAQVPVWNLAGSFHWTLVSYLCEQHITICWNTDDTLKHIYCWYFPRSQSPER